MEVACLGRQLTVLLVLFFYASEAFGKHDPIGARKILQAPSQASSSGRAPNPLKGIVRPPKAQTVESIRQTLFYYLDEANKLYYQAQTFDSSNKKLAKFLKGKLHRLFPTAPLTGRKIAWTIYMWDAEVTNQVPSSMFLDPGFQNDCTGEILMPSCLSKSGALESRTPQNVAGVNRKYTVLWTKDIGNLAHMVQFPLYPLSQHFSATVHKCTQGELGAGCLKKRGISGYTEAVVGCVLTEFSSASVRGVEESLVVVFVAPAAVQEGCASQGCIAEQRSQAFATFPWYREITGRDLPNVPMLVAVAIFRYT